MSGAGWTLQQALVNAVAMDAAVLTHQAGVYDFVPDTAAMPYVRVGVGTVRPWSSKTFDGAEYTARIDVWTESYSREPVLELTESIRHTLENTVLNVTGSQVVETLYEFGDILPDPDGTALHGVLRFRLRVRFTAS
jgi:hypothetical protein